MAHQLGVGAGVRRAVGVRIAQVLALDPLERLGAGRRLARRIVPLVLVGARQREEHLERAPLVLGLAVVGEQVQGRRRLAVAREPGQDVLPQLDRRRVVGDQRGGVGRAARRRGVLLCGDLGLDVLVGLVDVQIGEPEHRVGRELLVVGVIAQELLEQRDRVGVALAAIGLGARDPLGVALLELGGAGVVLAAGDRAHPRVVLVGGGDEPLVVVLDLLELVLLPGRELDRVGVDRRGRPHRASDARSAGRRDRDAGRAGLGGGARSARHRSAAGSRRCGGGLRPRCGIRGRRAVRRPRRSRAARGPRRALRRLRIGRTGLRVRAGRRGEHRDQRGRERAGQGGGSAGHGAPPLPGRAALAAGLAALAAGLAPLAAGFLASGFTVGGAGASGRPPGATR